jgi:hypothetical protein
VLAWHPADLTAAVTSLLDDAQRCPDCGLSDDDLRHVEIDVTRCPACEAKESIARQVRDEVKDNPAAAAGMKVRPFPVADPLDSVWATMTVDGLRWRDAERRRRDA